jgi:hypothetical protein
MRKRAITRLDRNSADQATLVDIESWHAKIGEVGRKNAVGGRNGMYGAIQQGSREEN